MRPQLQSRSRRVLYPSFGLALICLVAVPLSAQTDADSTRQMGTRAQVAKEGATAAETVESGGETAEAEAPNPIGATEQDPPKLTTPDPLNDPMALSESGTGMGELVAQLLKMVFMLGLVLALVYLVLNKGVGKLITKSQQGKRIQVVERVPLEQRRALYLITLDGKEMLLASSEGGVSVLTGAANEGFDMPTLRAAGYARDFQGHMSAHAQKPDLRDGESTETSTRLGQTDDTA